MRNRWVAVAMAAPAAWAGVGVLATRLGLLHETLIPAWLLVSTLTWGPLEVSVLAGIGDGRHPKWLGWVALAEAVGIYLVWKSLTDSAWM